MSPLSIVLAGLIAAAAAVPHFFGSYCCRDMTLECKVCRFGIMEENCICTLAVCLPSAFTILVIGQHVILTVDMKTHATSSAAGAATRGIFPPVMPEVPPLVPNATPLHK